MILSIFLAPGDSFADMSKSGQDELFKNFYLKKFSQAFKKVYVFSYKCEDVKNLPKNVEVVPNKLNLNRILYSFLLPILNAKKIKESSVIRSYHLLGTVPAIISRLIFLKKFVFNYAYDYETFAQIDGRVIITPFLKIFKPLAILLSSKIFVANKKILKTFSTNKTVYLPNGVDTSMFRPILNHVFNKNSPLVLSVGRLEKQKNFEPLIGAMKDIKAKLCIIGKGSLKKRLLLMAKDNKVSIEIIGPIPHSKMPKYYHKANIFVSSSLIEGHPKALLEAMSTGLPIIATSVEGNKELVKNEINGLLCETSTESIHDSISRLIKDRKKGIRLGHRARLTVENEYNLENLLRREVNVLQQVCQND